MKKSITVVVSVAAATALFSAGGVGAAVAAKLITGDDIAKNTVTAKNLAPDSVGRSELKAGLAEDGAPGATGPVGPRGPAGPSGQEGAFYSVAYYDVGNTNSGAIASVACDPTGTDFTAIAGGVQTLGLDGTPLDNNTPVSSSFPGRMNYDTNTPRPNRLDGWIVQFGGSAANPAPERVKVWALCVPRTDIPVKQTYLQSQ